MQNEKGEELVSIERMTEEPWKINNETEVNSYQIKKSSISSKNANGVKEKNRWI